MSLTESYRTVEMTAEEREAARRRAEAARIHEDLLPLLRERVGGRLTDADARLGSERVSELRARLDGAASLVEVEAVAACLAGPSGERPRAADGTGLSRAVPRLDTGGLGLGGPTGRPAMDAGVDVDLLEVRLEAVQRRAERLGRHVPALDDVRTALIGARGERTAASVGSLVHQVASVEAALDLGEVRAAQRDATIDAFRAAYASLGIDVTEARTADGGVRLRAFGPGVADVVTVKDTTDGASGIAMRVVDPHDGVAATHPDAEEPCDATQDRTKAVDAAATTAGASLRFGPVRMTVGRRGDAAAVPRAAEAQGTPLRQARTVRARRSPQP